MKLTLGTCGVIFGRILGVVGVAAAGAGVASTTGGQVFAHQFLQELAPGPNLGMVYNPDLQLMVKPGTVEPVYGPGSIKMAATSAVTQGSGPNGQGPHHDDD